MRCDASAAETRDVKAAIAVVSFILSNATKFSVDADSLSNELQQLGLPKGSFIQRTVLVVVLTLTLN